MDLHPSSIDEQTSPSADPMGHLGREACCFFQEAQWR